MLKNIKITGAKVHNLKNITVSIPKNQLTVITGPSGSGKSSLAFDTIYTEGQRRYVESLSSYARQFLGEFQPPDVESIEGLSPAIAIDQKTTSKNPRSTVGTITEIYDYLRVLFARVGDAHCPQCSRKITGQSAQQIVESILKIKNDTKVQILAPTIRNKKGEHREELHKYLAQGYSRIRHNGNMIHLTDDFQLEKNKKHNVDLVIDRFKVRSSIKARITDSVEMGLKLSDGLLILLIGNDEEEKLFSEHNVCHYCQVSFPELEPRLFSFNSPLGACSSCNGLGELNEFQKNLLLKDESLPLFKGAIPLLEKGYSFLRHMIRCMAKEEKVNVEVPYKKLPKKFVDYLFKGSKKSYTYSFVSENSTFHFNKKFPGLISWLHKKYHETSSEKVKNRLETFMNIQICSHCDGTRLNSFANATLIEDQGIFTVSEFSIEYSLKFFKKLKLTGEKKIIAEKLLKEIIARLKFLDDVGIGYLSLSRRSSTLSGGEAQRIRLATQIGSALTGVLYVLDEPSIGLHQRDNEKLIHTIKSLKNLGNTVIVVEHDEDFIRNADHIIDIGPHAGRLGGKIIAEGNPQKIMKSRNSITGHYLSKKKEIRVPDERRTLIKELKIINAHKYNIKNLNVTIPLGGLVCLTGVSGSGKSTLVHEILVPSLKHYLKKKDEDYFISSCDEIIGHEHLNSIIELDQSPIGRTPKSNPATYCSVFDDIRTLYSQIPEAKVRGYKAGRFSFNVKGGRCESCEGNGVKKIEMHFLPDVFISCSECKGKRYNKETLAIQYKGKNISDILEMTIEEANKFFKNHPRIHRTLETLEGVGLSYLKLGQPSPTLSGGEAQRLKLSRELSKKPKGHCLYILDEPTTGLHFSDIQILIKAINKLIDQGHSMIVIEHQLDIIKTADHIIDLGPEGGDKGGKLVAHGNPEEVIKMKKSSTGQFLKKIMK